MLSKIILSACLLSSISLQAAQSVKMAESSSSSSSAAAPAYEFTLAKRRIVSPWTLTKLIITPGRATIQFILTHNVTGNEIEKSCDFFPECITDFRTGKTVMDLSDALIGSSSVQYPEEERQSLLPVLNKAVSKFFGKGSSLISHHDIIGPDMTYKFNMQTDVDGEPMTPLVEEEKEGEKKKPSCTIL